LIDFDNTINLQYLKLRLTCLFCLN